MRAGMWTTLGLGSALLAAGGCDWRALDDEAKGAPVLSLTAPEGFAAADDYGGIVIPVGSPSDKDTAISRFVVSGVTRSALSLVELTNAGEASSANVNAKVFSGLHGNDGFPLTAIAEIPGPKPGKLLVAAKSIMDGSSVVYTVSLGDTHEGDVFTFTNSTSDPYLGLGVAAANLTGVAAPEYLIATPDALKVYIDGKLDMPKIWSKMTSGPDCPLELPGGFEPGTQPLNRPILIGHFLPDGPDLQVAMSTFGATGKGSISFFGVDATAGISCLGTITGDEPKFGRSFAVGDFNHDLVTDLVVGAPPTHAYVFLGPLSPTSTGIALPPDSDAIKFGESVGAVNVEGSTGGDQIVVGDPDAAVNDVRRAGAVTLFKLTGTTPSLVRKLQTRDLAEDGGFGMTITALPFCGMTSCTGTKPFIPVIGAAKRVLLFFTLGGTDLRKP